MFDVCFSGDVRLLRFFTTSKIFADVPITGLRWLLFVFIILETINRNVLCLILLLSYHEKARLKDNFDLTYTVVIEDIVENYL